MPIFDMPLLAAMLIPDMVLLAAVPIPDMALLAAMPMSDMLWAAAWLVIPSFMPPVSAMPGLDDDVPMELLELSLLQPENTPADRIVIVSSEAIDFIS